MESVEEQIAARLEGRDLGAAATIALRAYGPGILGYLVAVLRDEDDAAEVFSSFSEDLWRGIGGFQRRCSAKTWAYKLAWNAAMRFLGSPHRMRFRRLRTSEASRVAAEVRATSSERLLAGRQDRLWRIRQGLDPEEQALLVLRVDRHLAWREIAEVLSTDAQPIDSTTLRKRFERLKLRLRTLARDQGIIVRQERGKP